MGEQRPRAMMEGTTCATVSDVWRWGAVVHGAVEGTVMRCGGDDTGVAGSTATHVASVAFAGDLSCSVSSLGGCHFLLVFVFSGFSKYLRWFCLLLLERNEREEHKGRKRRSSPREKAYAGEERDVWG